MMYREYKDIQDLYVLHKYYVGGSQGDENHIEEIITSSDDKEALIKIGEQMFPVENRSGWNWYEYIIVINASTEVGRALYEAQKAEWKEQWRQIDDHPENYKGAVICGSRESGPIAIWMEHNPVLDDPQDMKGLSKSNYTYIVFDVSEDKPKEE